MNGRHSRLFFLNHGKHRLQILKRFNALYINIILFYHVFSHSDCRNITDFVQIWNAEHKTTYVGRLRLIPPVFLNIGSILINKITQIYNLAIIHETNCRGSIQVNEIQGFPAGQHQLSLLIYAAIRRYQKIQLHIQISDQNLIYLLHNSRKILLLLPLSQHGNHIWFFLFLSLRLRDCCLACCRLALCLFPTAASGKQAHGHHTAKCKAGDSLQGSFFHIVSPSFLSLYIQYKQMEGHYSITFLT